MKNYKTSLLLLSLFLSNILLPACEIPVFRYALERWPADSYTLLINTPHDRDLSSSEEQLIEHLRAKLKGEGGQANLLLKVQTGSSSFASMELRYPKASGILRSAWQGLLSEENLIQLVDSPARKTLEKYILSGESITWIVIESGNKSDDDKFVKALTEKLNSATKGLKLSDGIIQMDDADKIDAISLKKELDNLIRSTVPLKISFKVLRISRDNPQEEIFRKMLLGQSPHLTDISEPVAIPVFGRGRCIEGVPASKLSLDALKELTSYLCAGCSCTVKAENPGVDLVMNVPWADHISESVMKVKALPPITGLSGDLNISSNQVSETSGEKKTLEVNVKAEDTITSTVLNRDSEGVSPVFIAIFIMGLIGTMVIIKKA
ncbi:MAG: hypothetical protein HRT88_03575 [Lentisphaeraceae bacterium]|nr:hypothetical protein [Lentisphaeraceae bacterium]